jgi:hypothetical protein
LWEGNCQCIFNLKSLVDHLPFKGALESCFTKVIQGWNPSKSPSLHHGSLLLSQTFIAITKKTSHCHHWACYMWQQYFQIFIQGAIWFASTSGHIELTSFTTSSFTSSSTPHQQSSSKKKVSSTWNFNFWF